MARANLVEDGQGKFYGIRIDCPGCGDSHILPTDWTPDGYQRSPHIAKKPQWEFNGDLALPTLKPSIRATRGHYIPEHPKGAPCYCTQPDPDFTCGQCHSFVTAGRIAFCADSTHAFAGKTLDLPEIVDHA